MTLFFDQDQIATAPGITAPVELASGAVSVTPPAETAPTHVDVLAFVDTLPARHRQWFERAANSSLVWGVIDMAIRYGREAS